jgi:LAO/AO transport system kinase
MVDAFLFLAMPGTGDELQGIKKGIMEMADLIAINKSEGEHAPAAKRTRVELQRALQLSTRDEFNWTPTITLISALESQGFEELDAAIDQCIRHSRGQGWFDEKRRRQSEYWFEVEVQHALRRALQRHDGLQAAYDDLRAKVGQSEVGPLRASKLFIEELRRRLDR